MDHEFQMYFLVEKGGFPTVDFHVFVDPGRGHKFFHVWYYSVTVGFFQCPFAAAGSVEEVA